MVMKCLKVNRCKGTSCSCPQKRPIPIRVPVFFLASLIMLSMPTIAAAQSILQDQPTHQEDVLATCLHEYFYMNDMRKKGCENQLGQYMRAGCIQSLAGDWRWDPSGDIVRITYDEKQGAFGGRVIKPIKLGYNPGHLLFLVSFHRDTLKRLADEAGKDRLDSPYKTGYDSYIAFLRSKKYCRYWQFEGTEYSFDQNTKQKTEMKLYLVLSDDHLSYRIGRKTWHLYRIK